MSVEEEPNAKMKKYLESLDEDGLPKKPLKLTKLPFSLMKKSLNFMTETERLRIAAMSDRMELRLKKCKVETKKACSICLDNDAASIQFDNWNGGVAVTDYFPCEREEADEIPKEDIVRWLDDGKSTIDNLLFVFSKIQDLFYTRTSPILTNFILRLDLKESEIVKTIMNPKLQGAVGFYIENEFLKPTTVSQIFDLAETKDALCFTNYAFPFNFHHKNEFKCKKCVYYKAGWVRIEHLLSLKNKSDIFLFDTEFNAFEVNHLLRMWCHVDYDMFIHLKFEIDSIDRIESIFDGIPTLDMTWHFHRASVPVEGENSYVIFRKSESSERTPLAFVDIKGRTIRVLTEHEIELPQHLIELIKKAEPRYYHMKRITRGMNDVVGELSDELRDAMYQIQEVKTKMDEFNLKKDLSSVFYFGEREEGGRVDEEEQEEEEQQQEGEEESEEEQEEQEERVGEENEDINEGQEAQEEEEDVENEE